MSQDQNDKSRATEPEVKQPSPARQKDQARETSDEKGRDVAGADAIDSAGAEEDTYD